MRTETLEHVQRAEAIAKTDPAVALGLLQTMAAEHARVGDVDDELFCRATLVRIAIVARMPERALQAARIMLERKPTMFHVVQLAHLYERNGNVEEALRLYRYVSALAIQQEIAISQQDKNALLSPPEVTAYLLGSVEAQFLAQRDLGIAYLGMGRREDAVHELEVALSIRPGDEECISLLRNARKTST